MVVWLQLLKTGCSISKFSCFTLPQVLLDTGHFLDTLSLKITSILVSNETFLLGDSLNQKCIFKKTLTICRDITFENRRDVGPTGNFSPLPFSSEKHGRCDAVL